MTTFYFSLAVIAFIMLIILADRYTGLRKVDKYFFYAWEKIKKLNRELEGLLKQKDLELRKTLSDLQKEVAERKKTEEQLREKNVRLSELSARIQSVREDEQTRIAREIHDVLGQQLTIIKMELSWLLKTESGEKREKIIQVLEATEEALISTKKIATELRPPLLDHLGLAAAVDWHLKDISAKTGLKTIFTDHSGNRSIPLNISTALFRILQESLTNILRHSGATEVRVAVTSTERGVSLVVVDNGSGINETKVHDYSSLGILGIMERAKSVGGEASVKNIRTGGTRVEVFVPLAMLRAS